MHIVNAISKVRFSSVKPQCVQLDQSDSMSTKLVCMDPDQQLEIANGQWTYYIVTGTGTLIEAGSESEVATGHTVVLEPGDAVTLCNRTKNRLVCLAVGSES